jgi:mono/diheme cytochrome c family protein
MKKILRFFKWTAVVLGIVIVIFSITVASRQHLKFSAPYPDIKASTDSAVIARGEYLVYGPAHCVMCHVTNDKMELAEKGAKLPLSGGHLFDLEVGKIYSKNITPDKETGIGNLTDGEIARTLRYGVGHDERAMLDFMPFQNLSDEDLTAVISFL